jgi:hypothetical protein
MTTKAPPAMLKIRLPEQLRAQLEQAAQDGGTSLNAQVVRRLAWSFEPRERELDVTTIGVELMTAMQKLTESAEPLEIQGHLLRVLQEIIPLPPGERLDMRSEGGKLRPYVVDKEK